MNKKMSSEPTIQCPHCHAEIKLTESLAAPLVAATRAQYEAQLAHKNEEVAVREQALAQQAKQIAEERKLLEKQVADQVEATLQKERVRVIEEEGKKARLASAAELESRVRELADLQQVLKEKDTKLDEAQRAQADFLRKQRELDDARRELELTVEKRVQENLEKTRMDAQREAQEQLQLKVAERDHTIASLQKNIDELKRKVEQGSQQLQGEVQELELEEVLRSKFYLDSVEPVAKGEFGGDVLQRVCSQLGGVCGTIIWESKRTKHWNAEWLVKLRDDQRMAKADVAVIVTQTLPKEVETFDMVDGVWVIHPRVVLPVAAMLRQSLVDLNMARQSSMGQKTKAEMVYQYLTGAHFKQRVEAIVEAFSSMQKDLEQERKVMMRQWAKRSKQIDNVVDATVGMYGDLQGIAGQSLQEIEGLGLGALDYSEDDEE